VHDRGVGEDLVDEREAVGGFHGHDGGQYCLDFQGGSSEDLGEGTMTTTMDVSVVVPTYRRAANLPRLIAALEAQTLARDRFEVVVVDNGSDDDTPAVLAALAASSPLRLVPLRVEVNEGPARARNLGWRASSAPLVAFTDDDCVPRPDWLAQAVATAWATPHLGVLQGATLRPVGAAVATMRSVVRETLRPSPYFEGCNLVFPREVLERTGGFDESFPFSGEDTAAGWAAVEDGGEWVFDETAAVEHDVTDRPLRWHLMMAWREGNLVDVAARHPSMRQRGFWRPWAHRPWNVAYLLGLLATIAAAVLRQPLLLLVWVGWVRLRRLPGWPPLYAVKILGWTFVHDGVVCVAMLRASWRNRILVL
jgi:glycosyltransferase involved in cell wall biosynthesis